MCRRATETARKLNLDLNYDCTPSIAFGGFSGSAKGVTARQVGGRSILSVKCWPTGAATGAQLVRRASLKKISESWKELTSDQMHDLNRLAETNSTKTASAWASATSRTRYLQWIAVWQDSGIPAESLSHLPSL